MKQTMIENECFKKQSEGMGKEGRGGLHRTLKTLICVPDTCSVQRVHAKIPRLQINYRSVSTACRPLQPSGSWHFEALMCGIH